MAGGAFPPAPFLPSPDFVAWLDSLATKPPAIPLPNPEDLDE